MSYRIEPDLNNSRICYIYQDTENATRCKMTVISDFDLARRIVDYLNTPQTSATLPTLKN